jgi:hypothetical protein
MKMSDGGATTKRKKKVAPQGSLGDKQYRAAFKAKYGRSAASTPPQGSLADKQYRAAFKAKYGVDAASPKAKAAVAAAGKKSTAAKKKPPVSAQSFAENQLRRAGVKPMAGKAAQKQFRVLNKAVATGRTASKLGTIGGTGASSALAAGQKKGTARTPLTAQQFATNQLKKAGIKPTAKGDVAAQFRKANAAAAKSRASAKLGTARSVGATSALAAGSRSSAKKPTIQKSAAMKRRRAPGP